MIVYSLLPHSHFRGKASNFVATYPDGTQEMLLSVPNYDFNWQTTYELATPKRLPAGTKVTHSTTWDNSTPEQGEPRSEPRQCRGASRPGTRCSTAWCASAS